MVFNHQNKKIRFQSNNKEKTRRNTGIGFIETDKEFNERKNKLLFRRNNEKGTRKYLGIAILDNMMKGEYYLETDEEFNERIYYEPYLEIKKTKNKDKDLIIL